MPDASSLAAVRLSLTLSLLTVLILLLLGTPLAWWLARGTSRWRAAVRALVSLPLVLPPSVLGFYLLLALGAQGPIGRLTQALGWGLMAFSFKGLLVGSLLYSLPFVVQPLTDAFEAIGQRPLEAAATLRATARFRSFSSVPSAATAPPSSPPCPASTTITGRAADGDDEAGAARRGGSARGIAETAPRQRERAR